MELLKKDLNLVINCPAPLKHLSASTENGGRLFRQIFIFLSALGHRFYEVSMWNGAWTGSDPENLVGGVAVLNYIEC